MTLPQVETLGAVFGASELGLSLFKRSRGNSQKADRGSLALIWAVILATLVLCWFIRSALPQAPWLIPQSLYPFGAGVFAAGLLLRWYAIVYLGRWFTVDVAIATDHPVIDSGPYRSIRHPSYTGVLLVFLGYGLCLGNWLACLILVSVATAVFLWRIAIEEKALLGALGPAYAAYMRRTRRLIPLLY
ncbi:MAG: isoprenylcysteine carboxylmethyltransferase family protein [Dokdonella sp.]